jgi:cell division protein FtsQ
VIVLAGLLVGGWLWLRDSSLVAVTAVRVNGASTSDEARIKAALESAARDMTTLHVREEILHDVVDRFPSVAGLDVDTDFPHRMTIEVREHRPVAAIDVDGNRTPVSGGGVVLTGVLADDDLPTIRGDHPPQARVDDAKTKAALEVAEAAPLKLLRRGERLWWADDGLTVDLRDGPPLIFGNRDDAVAKWAAAARVLAEPSAAGATYLDLRVPGRVAAGGLGPMPQEPLSENPQP